MQRSKGFSESPRQGLISRVSSAVKVCYEIKKKSLISHRAIRSQVRVLNNRKKLRRKVNRRNFSFKQKSWRRKDHLTPKQSKKRIQVKQKPRCRMENLTPKLWKRWIRFKQKPRRRNEHLTPKLWKKWIRVKQHKSIHRSLPKISPQHTLWKHQWLHNLPYRQFNNNSPRQL